MDNAFTLQPNELGNIPLGLIDPDPEQPRKDFDEDYIAGLAASIKQDGVIQPIVVRHNPDQAGRFFIVAGENRWRASTQAKTKTIPAVLREVDGLTKLIIQLKENHQRKDLNPMEWALALRTMNKQHGLKQADIEKTLKESGVGNFGRSYISNTIRLLDLPDWAQDLIRNGRLTAAHGKYMLPAVASDMAMAQIHAKLLDTDWEPTTRDMQTAVFWAFAQNHRDLTGYYTEFDYKSICVASGCQKMRKVSNDGREGTFCLDQACHAKHQAEARAAHDEKMEARQEPQQNKPVPEIIPDENNRVDVDQLDLEFQRDYVHLSNAPFDVTECTTCPHRHIALESDDPTDEDGQYNACFSPECYFKKRSQSLIYQSLVENYLVQKARDRMRHDHAAAIRLLAWVAAELPDGLGQHSDGEEYIDETYIDSLGYEDEWKKLLFQNRLFSLPRFLEAEDEQLDEIAAYVVGAMRTPNLLELCRSLDITIGGYRIDEAYVAEHTEEELNALLDSIDLGAAALAERYNYENDGRLDQYVLDIRAEFGVPAEIRSAFARMTEEAE